MMTKRPSSSATVPMSSPTSWTLAFGSGSPVLASVTRPTILPALAAFAVATANDANKMQTEANMRKNLWGLIMQISFLAGVSVINTKRIRRICYTSRTAKRESSPNTHTTVVWPNKQKNGENGN